MISNKVVLTYKRKRSSSQSDLAHGIKETNSFYKSPRGASSTRLSPKAESSPFTEKLNGDNGRCFSCGAFDISEKLLGCDSCYGTYHLRCTDPLLKYIPEGEWQCSACIKQLDLGESVEQQVRKTKRERKSKCVEESEMGPMKLRSHKVLLGANFAQNSSRKASSFIKDESVNKMSDTIQMDYSRTNSGSACKVLCSEGSSRCQSTDLDVARRPSPVCFNSSTEEKCTSGCPEDSISKTVVLEKSDKFLCNDELAKENCSTPLITFRRRVKKTKDVGEGCMERNVLPEGKNRSATGSNHALGESFKHESLSQKDSFSDQQISEAVLREDPELSLLHVWQHNMMVNVEEDAGLQSTSAGGFIETKRTGSVGEGSPLHSAQRPNNVPEDPSIKFLSTGKTDVVRDSVLAHVSKQSNSPNIGNSVREESGIKFAGSENNTEGKITPNNASEERASLTDLELSVAPPTSTCLSNIASIKPSMDVMHENFLESQSLSPPSRAIVLLDKETNGRAKGFEWLETLDEAFQEAQKGRNTCSFMEQGGINCRQESNGGASPMIPINSSVQHPCEQDASRESVNQIIPSEERVLLTKSGDSGCKKQQYEETPNKSSPFTNFKGLALQLNPEAPVDSLKEFRSMISPSSLTFKDTVHINDGQLPWHASDGSSSLKTYKQRVENVLTGTRMLKEGQGGLLEKFRRYSSEWSEEELDFLWIGVRRHGIDNWNAMLRDPKLSFLESRVVEDLAERWDLEQRKLLNGTLTQPVRLPRPDLSLSRATYDALIAKPAICYGAWPDSRSESPAFTTETKLSLGDVYLQKENIPTRSLFRSSSLGTANVLRSESLATDSFLSKGFSHLMEGTRHEKPIGTQNTRYSSEPSIFQQVLGERSTTHGQHSAGLPTSSSLPHWLKEVFGMPPRQSELPLLPGVSAVAPSMSLVYNDQRVIPPFRNHGERSSPPKDSRGRGTLKRRNMMCGTNEQWMGTRFHLLPNLGPTPLKPSSDKTVPKQNCSFNLNEKSPGPIGPSELVVIDSDASSEETISDDQNSRL